MNDTISLLLAAFVLLFLIFRWFQPSQPGSTTRIGQGRRRPQRSPQDVPQEWVDVVCSAFPQINEAQARMDLARTWDVRQTCENVLAQGGQLPMPPNQAAEEARANKFKSDQMNDQASLVKRFEGYMEEEPPNRAWEQDPKKREISLKQRKAWMVMQARKKLLTKQQNL